MTLCVKNNKAGRKALWGGLLAVILAMICIFLFSGTPASAYVGDTQMSDVTLAFGTNGGTAVYGETIVISATIANKQELNGSFFYNWYKDGTQVQTGTSDKITLSDVGQSGSYRCRVTYKIEGVEVNTIYSDAVEAKISPFVLTVVWSDEPVYYSGAPTAPQATAVGVGGANITLVTQGNGTDASDVASYMATASVINPNYTLAPSTVTRQYGIAPRVVEVVWDALELEYNGALQVPQAHALSVSAEPMPLVVAGGGIYASTYYATASIDDLNYELTNETANFIIVPKTIAVYFEVPDNMIADGTTYTITATAAGQVANDIVNLVVEGGVASQAGIYTATVTATDNPNYQLPQSGISLEYTIFTKKLSVAAKNDFPEVTVVFDTPISPQNEVRIGRFDVEKSTYLPPEGRYFIAYYNFYIVDSKGVFNYSGEGYTVTIDVPEGLAILPKVSIVANIDGKPTHLVLAVTDGKISYSSTTLGAILFVNGSQSDYAEDNPPQTKAGLPTWAWVLIGLGGALMIGATSLGIYAAIKNKNKSNNKN